MWFFRKGMPGCFFGRPETYAFLTLVILLSNPSLKSKRDFQLLLYAGLICVVSASIRYIRAMLHKPCTVNICECFTILLKRFATHFVLVHLPFPPNLLLLYVLCCCFLRQPLLTTKFSGFFWPASSHTIVLV